MNRKILFLSLEFTNWHDACRYTYEANFGIEEGFQANNISYLTIPIFYQLEPSIWNNWQKQIMRLLEGQEFDQVWFEVSHAFYESEFATWLMSIAPIRVGWQLESIVPDPMEYKKNARGTEKRVLRAQQNSNLATHLIVVDEQDIEFIEQAYNKPTYWWCGLSIPKRFIKEHPLPPRQDEAVFFGTPYGNRRKWLTHDTLKSLIKIGSSAEDRTAFPQKYNQLIKLIESYLTTKQVIDPLSFNKIIDGIRSLRKASYPIWLKSLSQGSAVINLPQFGNAYASRVKQGMAIGRPVISWRIPDRPKTEALFIDGKEILLFDKDSPKQLAQLIKQVQSDQEFSKWIAGNALNKLKKYHTTEKFVQNVMKWIDTGQEPDYGINKNDLDNNNCTIKVGPNDYERLKIKQLIIHDQPIRLHLGCGEEHFEGYINIDYPPEDHNVMEIKADYYADITKLNFPDNSVDEIRLHHVFEHFPRVTALAMLIRWQKWLKIGGQLYIETPDFEGSVKTFLSNPKWTVKTGIIRHLTGDQSAFWGYHIEQWFPERFERTLSRLAFTNIQTKSVSWSQEPFLSNVHVIAKKTGNRTIDQLIEDAESILWESTVSPLEKPSYDVWCDQLREIVANGGSVSTPFQKIHPGNAKMSDDTQNQSKASETLYIGIKYYGHDSAIFSIDPAHQDQFGLATERVTRYKHDTLFPIPALNRMIAYKEIDPTQIKKIHLGSCFICQGSEKLPIHVYEQNLLERELFTAPYVKDFETKMAQFHKMPDHEKLEVFSSPVGKKYLQITEDQTLITLDQHFENRLTKIFPNATIELSHFDHEYCHAVSAYYSSPFETALVFAFDGYGDDQYFSRVYHVERGEFKEIGNSRSDVRALTFKSSTQSVTHECSIGGLYSYFTYLLGFRPDSDEGKVEALAAFGQWNNDLFNTLNGLVSLDKNGSIKIDHHATEQALSLDKMETLLQKMKKEDMAAAIQKFLEKILLQYVSYYIEKTGLRKICLSGGVAANVIANLRIYDSLVDEMFIVPAMADDGAAQGAVILTLLENGYSYDSLKWLKSQEMPYWGTSYPKDEIAKVIDEFSDEIRVSDYESDWPEQVAEAIIKGEVGAIYQGRMEWGPRALGNRSIVADVRNPEIQNVINKNIKNRPWFQPFCPSILEEERERLFEKAYTNKHMTTAFVMKPEHREALPGAIHVDGTARAQFVIADDNPHYYRLIKKVKELTGYGIILNTSFNKHGRTIVESPSDAIRDFLDTGMDFLVMEGFICRRIRLPKHRLHKESVMVEEEI
ncbi:MAG: carbamoyltransferase C-terminal domain-containing protein [Fidelibacterota bacterium]